jgi:hypothetical protein
LPLSRLFLANNKLAHFVRSLCYRPKINSIAAKAISPKTKYDNPSISMYPGTTEAGETLEFVDIGTSHSVTHPHSTVFLISQDYSSLSALPRSVCRLRSTNAAAHFSIQVL